MAVSTHSHAEKHPDGDQTPEIVVCETCPGRSIFLEAGNTDGWISSDVTMNVTQ
ncbi:hypothetical protein [Haladaptatus sp. ZSTT2]|uniref:hypothetical protein n=1 Tax=Haladaptatus sp. ZSTT2 TaxID=3120515 RepID=UPI00300F5505